MTAGTTPVTVPFLDLGSQLAVTRAPILEALGEVVDGSGFVLGPGVEAFEERFAAYVGTEHCVGVNSGTSALHLALIVAGVGPGDEVITVPMTFVATAWAVRYVGARPVFVDVHPEHYTMDVGAVEAAITERTKAVLPVHLYGQVADLDPLLAIGERYGIPIVEDAAQAHGASYRGRPAGAHGLLGCFSFYPGKILGAAGEAGAVVTDDGGLARRLRALRDHAQTERYRHTELGFNYRMDAFQGAVLGVKLGFLDTWVEARRAHAAAYAAGLAGAGGLTLPVARGRDDHAWHLFVVRHRERDRIRRGLAEAGISTGLHYPIPVHLQEAFADMGHLPGDFPVTERIAAECLSLPMFPELSASQIDHVCATMLSLLAEADRDG